ncbi:MAG: 23S rRNA (uracil(1939)-C(5))-methyltransferase RlmD [Atribacterota bacterium]|nr:23S rRNA (uracil(1939)-C(5))-methyltransferase RlmD [Atribacterota bacterium]
MELTIEGISHNGEGVARNEGKVVFVPYAIPGEIVLVDIVEEKKKYSRAVLKNIIKNSPYRVEPKCPYYYQCGGCSYQHVSYEKQLVFKKNITEEAVKRIGGVPVKVLETIGIEEPWNYRNKVVWHINKNSEDIKMGFYRNQSSQLIQIDDCPLLLPKLNNLSALIRKNLTGINLQENSSIMLRQSYNSNQAILEFINCYSDKKTEKRLTEEIDTIYEKRNGKIKLLSGERLIREKAGKCYFLLGAEDFFQINPRQYDSMINTVINYLNINKQDKVLDAYCGSGMFALNVAGKASSIIGIDSSIPAIKNARRNVELNGITNCKFTIGYCENVLPNLKEAFDRVIIDPPRTGLKTKVIDSIINASPETIIYVSCNPGTLARDLKRFVLNGYKVFAVQPVDMFPQTSHIENIVALQQKE